jgi:Holliday junction resolvase RusA-like endonuclease
MNIDLYAAERVDAAHTRIRFPQPGPLLNLNHRVHWSRRAAVTKLWRTAAYWAATTLAPSPADRAHDHRYVQMIIPVPDRRRRDPSNLIPLLKAAIDGLVDAHIWPDDTPEFVTTIEPYLFVQKPTLGEAPTIELALYRQPPTRHTQENP